MRVALITDALPVAGVAGHLALNHAVVAWLQGLGHRVEVVLVGSRLAAPVVRYAVAPVVGRQVLGGGGFVAARSRAAWLGVTARAVVRCLPAGLAARARAARHGADAVLGSFISPADCAWVARYVARAKPDAVLIDTIFRSGVLAAAALRGVNSVVLTHDVFHRRHAMLSGAGYRLRPARLTREDEADMLKNTRHIAAIQPEEAEILAAMCPTRNVFVLPLPAAPVPPPEGAAVIPGRLVFIGSATLPNLDGLRWFFAEVWPLLAGHGLSLDLIGDCGAALGNLPDGVVRLGRVAELGPLLHRAALAIAPLRAGSGLKIKLLDYARHGLLTIATPEALAGFAPDAASPFIAAAGAENFAEAILRHIHAPPAPHAALDYVTRHYGLAGSFAGLAKALGI